MTKNDGVLPWVATIDPPMSADRDDAIGVTFDELGGWIVDICVPDVPSVIAAGSEDDLNARERLFTRYSGTGINKNMLPDDVVEAMSISADRDQPMGWFRITLTADLLVSDLRVERITHRSAAQLSYLEADEILQDASHPLHDRIDAMWRLACSLHARRRSKTGAIFDEKAFVATTEEGVLEQLEAKESHRTHLVVMEIMILANQVLADHAQKTGLPVIYRNHVPVETGSGFRQDVIKEMNRISGMAPATAADRMIRLAHRIGRAGFGTTPKGHWGLDVEQYAWFTSPLRRYCDIVNLRALLHGEADTDIAETIVHLSAERMRLGGMHGLRQRSAIARHVARGEVADMQNYDLHTIIRACLEQEVRGPILDQEVRSRLADGNVSGKDIESVFTLGKSVLAEEVPADVITWLAGDAQRQIVLVRDMVMRQRMARVPTTTDGKLDLVEAMRQMSGILGADIPVADELHTTEAPDRSNPKGALLELGTARKATVEFVETARIGPPHDRRFTVEARWTENGQTSRTSASDTTVKTASKGAAFAMLTLLRPNGGDTTPEALTIPTGNAKSRMLEIAAARKANVAFRLVETSGPPHNPVFVMEAVYETPGTKITGQGRASSKKEAERLASQDVMEQLAA